MSTANSTLEAARNKVIYNIIANREAWQLSASHVSAVVKEVLEHPREDKIEEFFSQHNLSNSVSRGYVNAVSSGRCYLLEKIYIQNLDFYRDVVRKLNGYFDEHFVWRWIDHEQGAYLKENVNLYLEFLNGRKIEYHEQNYIDEFIALSNVKINKESVLEILKMRSSLYAKMEKEFVNHNNRYGYGAESRCNQFANKMIELALKSIKWGNEAEVLELMKDSSLNCEALQKIVSKYKSKKGIKEKAALKVLGS